MLVKVEHVVAVVDRSAAILAPCHQVCQAVLNFFGDVTQVHHIARACRALYLEGVAVAAITDSSFSNNTAVSNGGAIFSNNAGLLEVSSTSFMLNKGQTGGAVSDLSCHQLPKPLLLMTKLTCFCGKKSSRSSLQPLQASLTLF